MAERQPQQEEDEIDRLVHDIGGCLNAIGMGIAVLNQVRSDDSRYTEVCDSIVKEQQSAMGLLRELREFVRQNEGP